MAMTFDRISQVLAFYEKTAHAEAVFTLGSIEALDKTPEENDAELRAALWRRKDALEHIAVNVIPQMREQMSRGEACNREKLMRWYGFIQGQFTAFEVFTLEEAKAHSSFIDALKRWPL